jgi:alkylation response protein AidB-like acyl-CoA dehydrogenase
VSLSLNPALTHSAIELLLHWGTESQQSRFLPRLVTGEWSATMDLTEPEAGSDLAEIRTEAESDGDRWRVTGTKVFISWGEHDLTSNIIHMVLARTPGGPPGTRGLSLFVVPRELGAEAGRSTRNAIRCTRVESKLGLHASPTCVLEFDRAEAELVGPLHGGMRAMFTMMNAARLSIGLQGPSIGERAYQQAVDYARNRYQGTTPSAPPTPGQRTRALIVQHPDVRRMLSTMRVLTQASRLLIYTTTGYRDLAQLAREEQTAASAQEYVDLLTPVAKSWSTDVGFTVCSLGVQIFGGAGYVEETGMAQYLRDARIASIYEGTNGIQAIDLVTRKLPRRGGAKVRELINAIDATLASQRGSDIPLESFAILGEVVGALKIATDWILERNESAPSDALAGASAYLELLALAVAGWLMIRRATLSRVDGSGAAEECEFFATEVLTRGPGLLRSITAGASRLDGLALELPND